MRGEIEHLNESLDEARAAIAGHEDLEATVTIRVGLLNKLGKATKRLRDMLVAGGETKPARARRSDPDSSRAAAAIPLERLRASQTAIYDALRLGGHMTDEQLVGYYLLNRATHNWPTQSRSGIRTRRKELVRAGHVVKAGMRRDGRARRTIWRQVNEGERA